MSTASNATDYHVRRDGDAVHFKPELVTVTTGIYATPTGGEWDLGETATVVTLGSTGRTRGQFVVNRNQVQVEMTLQIDDIDVRDADELRVRTQSRSTGTGPAVGAHTGRFLPAPGGVFAPFLTCDIVGTGNPYDESVLDTNISQIAARVLPNGYLALVFRSDDATSQWQALTMGDLDAGETDDTQSVTINIYGSYLLSADGAGFLA